jgi:hypothetical protein
MKGSSAANAAVARVMRRIRLRIVAVIASVYSGLKLPPDIVG